MARGPSQTNLIGQLVGRYRVEELLGEGGMAQVYAARHVDPKVDRKIAVKVLLPEYSSDPRITERFLNEARAASRVDHPGVVAIFDVEKLGDGRICLLMEYLQGLTLTDWLIRRKDINIPLCVDIATQVASVLAAAHAHGIIHRDIKPDNIFLVQDPVTGALTAKVLDFGIAKLLEGAGNVVTATSSTFGTAEFMSPEQFRSAKYVDRRADIYSLGCVLYLMLTGRPPFIAKSLTEHMNAHVFEQPSLPISHNTAVPDWLDKLVLHMLAKAAEDRPQAMDEVISVLSAHIVRPGVRANGKPWLAIAIALIIVAGGAFAIGLAL